MKKFRLFNSNNMQIDINQPNKDASISFDEENLR